MQSYPPIFPFQSSGPLKFQSPTGSASISGTNPINIDLKGAASAKTNSYFGLQNSGYGFFPNPSFSSVSLLYLPHWRKKRAGVLNKTGNAEIWCLGDSTTYGEFASNPYTTGYPARLRQLLNSVGIPAMEGLVVPVSGSIDSRWVITGWSSPSKNPNGENTVGATNATTQTLSFSPGFIFDSFRVFWAANGGSGTGTTCVVNVDGGSSIGTLSNNTAALGTQSFSCTRDIHTINILPPTAANEMFINGIECYDSMIPAVHITNFGVIGNVVSQFNNPFINMATWISQFSPDLSIIDYTINDAVHGTNLTAYQSSLASVIASCQVNGDVIVSTGNPVNPTEVVTSTHQQYVNIALATAQTMGAVSLDSFGAFGASWTFFNGYGYNGDNLHPNDFGYMDKAYMNFEVLR